MPAIEQHRRPAIRSGELQPAGSGHVRRLHLGDHAGERPVAQRVLSHGENVDILAALRIEQLARTKTYLFEARRVEVEGSNGP